MDNLPVKLQPGELPKGYCFPGNPQQFYNDIIAITGGYVPGNYNFFNYGNTEPLPEDRNKPWVRLFPDGSPDLTYVYFGGFWCSKHPVPASSQSRIWWTGSEADAWAYDGGDGSNPSTTPPTDATGAMWQRDADYDARFPLQAGVLPSGATVSPGDVGGEEKHTMTVAELVKHSHLMAFPLNRPDGPFAANIAAVGNTEVKDGDFSQQTGETGSTTPFNVMPPYRVGMWLKRTSRRFYTPS